MPVKSKLILIPLLYLLITVTYYCSRMRICHMYTFVVPSFGSLGTQALSLIKDIGRRTYLFVPPALAHETSWATMSITSFLRSAITFQVCKRKLQFYYGSISLMISFPPLLMPSRPVEMCM